MPHFDGTIHLSDLIAFAGVTGAAVLWLVREVRKLYRSIQEQLEAHAEELSLHATVLSRMGWKRPKTAKFKPILPVEDPR